MEAVVIGAFLNTFLPKVLEVIEAGAGLRDEIEEDIVFLGEELPLVDAYIRDHGLQCTSPSSEVTLISRACRLAEDTELCISRFLLCHTGKKKTRPRDDRKMSYLKFSGTIKAYRKRLEKIIEDLDKKKEDLERSTMTFEEPNDPQWGEEEELAGVGMAVSCQELEELLEPTPPDSGTKRKLKVISIVGFGGSGKTRLAKQVFEDVRQKFSRHAWVCLAKRNVNEVLLEILEKVTAGSSSVVQQVDNEAGSSSGVQHVDNGASASTSVMERLKSCLCKQRYLIVFDDVRSKDDWSNLKKALPDSDVGSRIIVTTTSHPLAELCSSISGQVYKMSTLCDQDSQELFSNASSQNISPANKIQFSTLLKTCDGLPLALIESAKPFKGRREVHYSECQKVIRNLCVPEEGSNGTLTRMQWVLMNKYSSLTSYGARACLLYFNMFPFENPTKSKFLTRRWLAEGLVQRDDTNVSDLDAASNYLRTFRDNNIIRSMQVSNNATVKSCTLPGTMHQFIYRQCVSQDFVTFLRHKDEPLKHKNKAIRRLSLYDSQASIEDVKLNYLRTLAVSGKACEAIMDFPKYEVLQVLDLKDWDFHRLDKGKKLQEKLKEICKLIMLKYLGLPGNIGEVPREIGDLIHLETLDVGEAEIVMVYGEVIKLPRLKHLLGKFRLSDQDSPGKCVPKVSRLDTFSGFFTDGKAAFAILMKDMKQLRKVKMWCDFKADRGEMKHLPAAIKDFISLGSTEPCDRTLSIDLQDCKAGFLESLEGPGRLTKLKLRGRLEKVPKFLTAQKVRRSRREIITPLNGVTKLCLSLTTMCGKDPLFPFRLESDAWLLPLLKYLKLEEDELGPLKIAPMHFPSLERLYLVSKTSLDGITIEAGALQFLVSLHIMCKAQIGLAGIQIERLESLEEIALDSEVPDTRSAWKRNANDHPNQPCVLFIEAALTTCPLNQVEVQNVPGRPWYRNPLNFLRGSQKKR